MMKPLSRSVLGINLEGCYWMAQAAARVMPVGSSIINVSSVAERARSNWCRATSAGHRRAGTSLGVGLRGLGQVDVQPDRGDHRDEPNCDQSGGEERHGAEHPAHRKRRPAVGAPRLLDLHGRMPAQHRETERPRERGDDRDREQESRALMMIFIRSS